MAMLARLRAWANARTATCTLLAGVVLAGVYAWIVAPWLRNNMGGEKLLDELFWRTPANVDAALETYGRAGRDFYRKVLLADLLFPLVYVPLLALSVAFAGSTLPKLRRHASIWLFLPIAGGVFDWGENLSLLIRLGRGSDQSDAISWFAFAMTFLKFAALGLSLVIIAFGLMTHVAKRYRKV